MTEALAYVREYVYLVLTLLLHVVSNVLLLLLSPALYLYARTRGDSPAPPRAGESCARCSAAPTSIFITGASSGVGESLAYEYCRRARAAGRHGALHLFLTGRSESRLRGVAEACRALGAAHVAPLLVDVRDAAAMRAAILEADARRPLEMVVANAGVSPTNAPLFGERAAGLLGFERARAMLDINMYGVMHTLWPAMDLFAQRGRGHLVVNASIGALTPGPVSSGYAASKAFVRFYGEALRPALAPLGVRVSTVLLGLVDSRMTAPLKARADGGGGERKLPFGKSGAQCARAVTARIARNEGVIMFPEVPIGMCAQVLNAMPPVLREAAWRVYVRRRLRAGLKKEEAGSESESESESASASANASAPQEQDAVNDRRASASASSAAVRTVKQFL